MKFKIFTRHIVSILIFNFLLMSSLCAEAPTSQEAAPQIEETQSLEKDLSPLDFDDANLKQMSYWKEFFRMMMMLGVILGVVLILAWFLRGFLNRRIKQVNESHYIKVLERRNLSQKSMVYLIEVHGKQHLIGDSASGGVQYLLACEKTHENESTTVAPQEGASKSSFMEILQKKLSEKRTYPFKIKK